MKLISSVLLLIALAGLTACKESKSPEEKFKDKQGKAVDQAQRAIAEIDRIENEMRNNGLVEIGYNSKMEVVALFTGDSNSSADIEAAKRSLQEYTDSLSTLLSDAESSDKFKISNKDIGYKKLKAAQKLLDTLNQL